MSDNQEPNKHLNAIMQTRGMILQNCIEIEMIMDFYIASHFCQGSEKIYELATIVLAPRVPWREKLAVFTVLIEKYNKPFKVDYPDFSKDITSIIEHRNIFAHLPADTSVDGFRLFNEGELSFLKFKNFKVEKTKEIEYVKTINYSMAELEEVVVLLKKYSKAVKSILAEF